MSHRFAGSVVLFVLAISLGFGAAAPAQPADFMVSGSIDSGAEFDLYDIELAIGHRVTGLAICTEDPGVPGSRPLDPVLRVYFPGGDPSDDTAQDVFNDDGFGLDDDPNGVDCDAFDSSRVQFIVPFDGTYTFRVDGFGSSTGPYDLIVTSVMGPIQEIPTLGTVGLAALAGVIAVAALLLFRRRD